MNNGEVECMSDTGKLTVFSKITLIPLAAILAGVVFGSVGAGRIESADTTELTAYFNNFFGQVPSGNMELFFSSLKKYFVVWVLIFSSGFIIPGSVINIFSVWRRGYIIGYTSGCFCRVYGVKGIIACVGLLPEMLVFIPVLAFFSSISLKMSFFAYENKKLFLKKYLFFSFIFLSVFCVVSCLQTFLTTIFMSIISKLL